MGDHSLQHLNTAVLLVRRYSGDVPLGIYLKGYFKLHKQHGSKDRKIISQLCYSYFRAASFFRVESIEETILLGAFLSSRGHSPVLQVLKPAWNEKIEQTPEEKLIYLKKEYKLDCVFPFSNALSKNIDKVRFSLSFFIQPDLFLRARPGQLELVQQKLKQAGIEFESLPGSCLRLPNATKVESIIVPDQEAVVQDLNSQKVFTGLMDFLDGSVRLLSWDCCAASGGKSILFHDHFPLADITVSDVRSSIIKNLQHRFQRAGIKNYRSYVRDASVPGTSEEKKFDVIIADVPCSGSGTWARTPEQLSFFKIESMDTYAALQKRIALNIVRSLKQGGYLLYITCSVFEKENEEVVHFLQAQGLNLLVCNYFQGYEQKADTLFAAVLRKI